MWQTSGETGAAQLVDLYNGQGVGFRTNYLMEANNRLFCAGQGGVHVMTVTDPQLYSLDEQTGNDWRFLYENGAHPKAIASTSLLYFVASQFAQQTNSTQVWVTDGTVDGTKLLSEEPFLRLLNIWRADIHVQFHVATDTCLFFSMDTETAGKELWYSDGSAEGTSMLTGFDEAFPLQNKQFGDAAFLDGKCFVALSHPDLGSELWMSNGTREGTSLFLDLVDGVNGSEPSNLLRYEDYLLFFTEGDGVQDPLWISDGTVEGTKPMPWNAERLFNFKEALIWQDDLYFVATHPEKGQGIFSYDLEVLTGVTRSKDAPMNTFSVYPNPASDMIHIDFEHHSGVGSDVMLFDTQGRTIRIIRQLDGDSVLHIADLPPGIYFIRIGEEWKKLVKM